MQTVDQEFRSDRYFKVWAYTVSHRRLLLRSTRDDFHSTRIDLHVGGVSLMLLRPYYHGLVLRRGTDEELEQVTHRHRPETNGGILWVFGEEGDLSSYVLSGPAQWHEDEAGHTDRPPFGHMVGTS